MHLLNPPNTLEKKGNGNVRNEQFSWVRDFNPTTRRKQRQQFSKKGWMKIGKLGKGELHPFW